jgi:mannan endo-1,6-alpha-mannosidase
MFEACEASGKCNVDQKSFKAYLSRWMAQTSQVAPFTYDTIKPLLVSSAAAAAKSCSGGADGVTCGNKWTTGIWDGSFGVGEQMSALSVIQSTLIDKVAAPVTNSTGGTSTGNSAAGTGSSTNADGTTTTVVTSGDRVGAGFLTALILALFVGGTFWLVH